MESEPDRDFLPVKLCARATRHPTGMCVIFFIPQGPRHGDHGNIEHRSVTTGSMPGWCKLLEAQVSSPKSQAHSSRGSMPKRSIMQGETRRDEARRGVADGRTICGSHVGAAQKFLISAGGPPRPAEGIREDTTKGEQFPVSRRIAAVIFFCAVVVYGTKGRRCEHILSVSTVTASTVVCSIAGDLDERVEKERYTYSSRAVVGTFHLTRPSHTPGRDPRLRAPSTPASKPAPCAASSRSSAHPFSSVRTGILLRDALNSIPPSCGQSPRRRCVSRARSTAPPSFIRPSRLRTRSPEPTASYPTPFASAYRTTYSLSLVLRPRARPRPLSRIRDFELSSCLRGASDRRRSPTAQRRLPLSPPPPPAANTTLPILPSNVTCLTKLPGRRVSPASHHITYSYRALHLSRRRPDYSAHTCISHLPPRST